MLHAEHESGNTDIEASSLNWPQLLQEKGTCEEIPKYVALPIEVGDSSFINPMDPNTDTYKYKTKDLNYRCPVDIQP